MTTKGQARHGNNDFGDWLRQLPDVIARCEERGVPVVVALPVPVSVETQRLMATLGVLVRFTTPSAATAPTRIGDTNSRRAT